MHSEKKREEDTGKEEINVFYNQENGGVDSHDQMCSLCTTARKTNRWPMRLFYGIIDSTALNALVIFTKNIPKFLSAANTARCETGYSQLRHFTSTLTNSKHHARGATFVTDQRTRKPNSSVISEIILCAKSTAKVCATNAWCKS